MSRPKKLKRPARLNLLLNGAAKKRAVKMAAESKISVGELFEQLVEKAGTAK